MEKSAKSRRMRCRCGRVGRRGHSQKRRGDRHCERSNIGRHHPAPLKLLAVVAHGRGRRGPAV
eukprot:3382010-Prymnesium_polylepis.1